MFTRRRYLFGAALGAGAALWNRAAVLLGGGIVSAQDPHAGHGAPPATPAPPAAPRPTPQRISGLGYNPVVTPNGSTLPFVMKAGVKEFHLTAQPVRREFAPGMTVNCWGYNGETPGPTIEAVEGDRIRILVTNALPEHTTIHWHGLFLPNGMDGAGGLTQPQIKPGETFVYEFTLRQHGTFMYHPHADETVQMAMGMMGFFVVHPKTAPAPAIDRDFCLFPHMWYVAPGSYTPDPNVMLDFNIFTLNGRAFPGTDALVVRHNDRVRIRLANVSMTSHPLHIHGHRMWVVETDGGPIPRSAWWPETTIDVSTGTTRAVEFVADAEGDWPFHCHKSHHAMNAMGHDVPNVIGVKQDAVAEKIRALVPGYMAMGSDGMASHAEHAGHMAGVANTLPMMTGAGPFGNIEMGGMFTVLKVRAGLKSYEDPGWYRHPEGTVAWKLERPKVPGDR